METDSLAFAIEYAEEHGFHETRAESARIELRRLRAVVDAAEAGDYRVMRLALEALARK